MADLGQIQTDIRGAAGYLLLDRSSRANAYTRSMLESLDAGRAELEANSSVRVIVVTGLDAGFFCSGADLDELKHRKPAEAFDLFSLRVFDRLSRCPAVTIAAVDGPAVGGGLELALTCDFRIATTRARFRLPETSLGLIPAAGGTWRLPAIAGLSLAREMILAGREIDAERARRDGLVNEVVEPDGLAGRVDAWTAAIADRDPEAIRLAKRALALAHHESGCRELSLVAQAMLVARRRERTG